MISDMNVDATFEGDNTVMMQQVFLCLCIFADQSALTLRVSRTAIHPLIRYICVTGGKGSPGQQVAASCDPFTSARVVEGRSPC